MKLLIVFLVSPHAVSTCKRMYSLSMSTCSLVPTLHGRREMWPVYEARASVVSYPRCMGGEKCGLCTRLEHL